MKNKINESKSSKILEVIIEEPINTKKNRNKKIKRNIKSSNNFDFSFQKYQSFKGKSNFFMNNNSNKNKFGFINLKKRFSDLNTFTPKINKKIILTHIKKENLKLIKDNNNEINIKTKGKLKRAKSHTFISNKKIINARKNLKIDLNLNNLENNLNNNLYITSTPITQNHNEKWKTFENEKNEINKSKNDLKRNKSSLLFSKKIKSLDEIIKEIEIKFESKYKKPKSYRKYLSKIYKNNLLYKREDIIENKEEKYIAIKSNIEKLTKSSENRKKINLSKLKEYFLFKDQFQKSYKEIINLDKEINKMREKHYISSNNYDTLSRYQKYLISNKNYIYTGDEKSINYSKKEKPDSFALSEFSNKIKNLDGLVAFQNRYFLANKLGFKWDTIYLYKKSQRHLISNKRNKENKFGNKMKIKYQKPDELLI